MPDTCPRDWFAYLEDEVTLNRSRELQQHLHGCDRCRAHLEQDRRLLRSLAQPDQRLVDRDLLPAIHRRLAAAQAEPPPARRRSAVRVGLAAAAAAVAGVVIVCTLVGTGAGPAGPKQPQPAATAEPEVRVKGAGGIGQPEQPDRLVGLQVYRLPPGGEPRRLTRGLQPGDHALFAYTNLASRPYSHLMILAVDAAGAIHWYYPAYLEPADDPTSIPIRARVSAAPLPEKIRHDFAPGRLCIVGLFTRTPLRVSQVEAVIRELRAAGGWSCGRRLPIADSGQHAIETRVRP
jgi:hypothetical protein